MYNEYDDGEMIDLLPVQSESLVVRHAMVSPKAEDKIDRRHKSIYGTKVICIGKDCKMIDGGSSEKKSLRKLFK